MRKFIFVVIALVSFMLGFYPVKAIDNESSVVTLGTKDDNLDKNSLKDKKQHKAKKKKIINNTFLRPGQDSDEDIILEPDEKN